ncbi:MAG: hypothetical protein DID89_2727546763 [Candidatus Nitrotoga sp. CP45]|nr:MAG: hypothetical protein DID89_2727546763 [Candidatus Nitrotoga sp. CP45]
MERSADSEMMHSKSIGNLLHRIFTGFISLLYAVLQDLAVLFNRIGELLLMLAERFVSNPREFFLPPRQ